MRQMLAVFLAAALGWFAGSPAMAAATGTEVAVSNAWVRATVPGQPVAGAYLDLRATGKLELIGVSSPVADRGEIHEMKDEDGMMKMRAVAKVDLPAAETVSLAPGGQHVMLFGIRKPLVEGTKVTLTLKFRRRSGSTFTRRVEAPVKAP